jgi:hypothetical protein
MNCQAKRVPGDEHRVEPFDALPARNRHWSEIMKNGNSSSARRSAV